MNKKQNYINNEDTTLLLSIANFKSDLSHKTIKNYIKNGMVKVNNKTITNSSHPVKPNDNIEISYTKNKINEYDLDILYEDNYLIAINKPDGLLSIGNDKEKEITAYRMVSDYVKKTSNKYIFVVHRLDQDTSGILMFCKNKNIRDKMQENWNTIVKKRGYLAIVDGKLDGNGTIKSFLAENKQQFYKKLETEDIFSQLEILNNIKNLISIIETNFEQCINNGIKKFTEFFDHKICKLIDEYPEN